jgi:uncharacterized delta-60 repeat protein
MRHLSDPVNTKRFMFQAGALAVLFAAADAWGAPGDVDLSFQPAVSIPYARSVVVQPDGRILVATTFAEGHSTDTGEPSGGNTNALLRFHADGRLDVSLSTIVLDAGRSLELAASGISCIAHQPDGRILIGGYFRHVNGSPRYRLARLDPDGEVDTSFEPSPVLPGARVLALQSDGKIIAGFIGTQEARGGVVRLNPDGSMDEHFVAELWGGSASAIALQPDRKILVGGGWNFVGGYAINSVVRLNPDGSLDAGFADPRIRGEFRHVSALALQPDGKILIGGSFTSVSGHSRRGIARLNADGTLDTSFNPGTGISFRPVWEASDGYDYWDIYALALQPDGKVLVGGKFERVNGIPRRNLARLNSDGSVDPGFMPGNAPGQAFGLALQPDGKVLLAGSPSAFYTGEVAEFPTLVRLHGGDLLPSLKIGRSGSELVLSWPVAGGGDDILESRDRLNGTADWTRENAVHVQLGDQYVVPIENHAPARFYRLRRD